MGTKYKNIGGSGTGLGQDVSSWLMNGLNTGTFGGSTGPAQFLGANPIGQTNGISGFLNNVLGAGAGTLGGSLGQLLQTQQTNDVNSLRARFGAGGGTSFGTPAAYAESSYRAQAAPQIATQVGQLQLQALSPILGLLNSFGQKDIPQAEIAAQENPWLTAAKLGIGAGSMALGFMGGGPAFGALGGLGGGGMGGLPGVGMGQVPTFTPNMYQPFQQGLLQNGANGGNALFNPMLLGYSPSFSLRQ